MEQDIKVLEEMVEKSRDLKEEDFYKLIGIKQIQSISNFIKAYKELEEKLDETLNANLALVQGNANSIPVSLVEKKIEELNKKEQELQNSISDEEREKYSDANISFELMDIEIRRSILQELLEKR